MRVPPSFKPDTVTAGLAVALGLAAYGWVFDFALVFASHPFWRNPPNDMTIMTGGFEAFLKTPWAWPPTVVSGLAPQPFSIVFTDSVPWLALALKVLGLGEEVSLLGLFLLASYPLQALGMLAVLRALGVEGRWPQLFGVALALLFPAWLGRQYGHIALSGHWILLFSLAVSVGAIRWGLTWRRIGAFAGLAALATGVHAYHLVPIAAVFAAALLSELLQRRGGARVRVLSGGLLVTLVVGLCALALGYRVGPSATGGADALGVYAMNLLGPVLPTGSRLFGQIWTGSWFIGVIDPTGAQSFEGLQYLGAGGLLLLGSAALGGLAALRRRPLRRRKIWRWAPLALAVVGLYAWAVGWNVYFGTAPVAQLPKPSGMVAEVLGGFRAHGRFFWIGGYLLLALGVLWASRLAPRKGVVVLGLAVALQAWDLGPLRQGLGDTFTPQAPAYPPALAQAEGLQDRAWVFAPTFYCSPSRGDQAAIAQLTLLAVRRDGTTNTFPTARSVDPPCGETPPDIGEDAAPGDRRIFVVTSNGLAEGGALQLVNWRTDCHRWTKGVMCGEGLAGIAGLTPVRPGELNGANRDEVLTLQLDQPPKPAALSQGWAELDLGGKGIWTIGPWAQMQLDIPSRALDGSPLVLELKAIGFSDPPLQPQRVAVSLGGRSAAALEVDPRDFAVYRIAIPPEVLAPGEPLEVAFDLPDARSSAGDPRVLGIAVQTVKILKLAGASAAAGAAPAASAP